MKVDLQHSCEIVICDKKSCEQLPFWLDKIKMDEKTYKVIVNIIYIN